MKTPLDSVHQTTPGILITGATGNIGTELTKLLAHMSIPFRAMVRHAEQETKLASLPGAAVVAGDFNDVDSLADALHGIERVFLLTPSSEQAEEQQLRFVGQAKQAGVQHIVKLSQLAADEQSPVRFLHYHAVVERAIRESGVDFTFLRPNLFMQGLLSFRSTIAGAGQFWAPIGNAPVSVVDVRDIAAVAVAALTQAGHAGRSYTLTGPDSLTHAQMASQLATALGKPVSFVNVSPEQMRAALNQISFPAWQAEGLIEDYAHYSRHEASAVSSDVQAVTRQPPRPFAEFARDYADTFLPV
ncbi:SDR family oxidoreductase [Spirosoma sordidisoli]|uniref:SDR family oxidoreductase n=1 Tax=Spirosoma sordidisoli TaxID=2502893 RepID=A0A4Q2UGV3_9BACT|nr:SDR family oxidoreductase [Spirosoma sordidisoli]RYC66641.1 SDR family oxidoreductase [Spirosoma sordidisoli]